MVYRMKCCRSPSLSSTTHIHLSCSHSRCWWQCDLERQIWQHGFSCDKCSWIHSTLPLLQLIVDCADKHDKAYSLAVETGAGQVCTKSAFADHAYASRLMSFQLSLTNGIPMLSKKHQLCHNHRGAQEIVSFPSGYEAN